MGKFSTQTGLLELKLSRMDFLKERLVIEKMNKTHIVSFSFIMFSVFGVCEVIFHIEYIIMPHKISYSR